MKRLLPSGAGVLVVALFSLFSIASTGGGDTSQCGDLVEDQGVSGDPCTDRDQCNEVCCLCEGGGAVFVARGCDLPAEICLGGDDLCSAALESDPSLCEPAGAGLGDGADLGVDEGG